MTAAGARARALFAAACAERLFGLYALGERERLRAALDLAWAESDDAAALEGARQTAEALVPAEDADWVEASAFAQNAAAAVAYALRTRLTDHPQEAAWAARQVYDAADYAAQQRVEGFDEEALAAQPIVQAALAGIAADLETALAEDVSRLREQARHGSATLAELT